MTIEYVVSEEDYINFNLYHRANSKQYLKSILWMRIIGAIFIFIIFLLLINNLLNSGTYTHPIAIIGAIVGAIAWIVVIPTSVMHSTRDQVKKFIAEGKNNDFIGPQKLTLHDNYIETYPQKEPQKTLQLQASLKFDRSATRLFTPQKPIRDASASK